MCSCLHIQVEQGKSTEIFLVEKSNITKCLGGNAGRKISTKTLVSGSKVLYLLFRQVFYNFLTGIFSSWLTNVPLKKESLMPPGEIGREKEAQINWRSRDEVCLESVWLLWESLNLFALFINLWSNNFPLFVDCLFASREEINP